MGDVIHMAHETAAGRLRWCDPRDRAAQSSRTSARDGLARVGVVPGTMFADPEHLEHVTCPDCRSALGEYLTDRLRSLEPSAASVWELLAETRRERDGARGAYRASVKKLAEVLSVTLPDPGDDPSNAIGMERCIGAVTAKVTSSIPPAGAVGPPLPSAGQGRLAALALEDHEPPVDLQLEALVSDLECATDVIARLVANIWMSGHTTAIRRTRVDLDLLTRGAFTVIGSRIVDLLNGRADPSFWDGFDRAYEVALGVTHPGATAKSVAVTWEELSRELRRVRADGTLPKIYRR